MAEPRILAFAGSAREGSYNKKVVRVAAEGAREAGADVTVIDLRDFPLPLMDEDLEAKIGLPEEARKFRELLYAHDGWLISSPENNSSISSLLKNSIDWASREQPGEKPFRCFEGKVVTLMSASPGQLGGLRGLVTVRSILGNMRCILLPTQVCVGKADEAFAEDGSLKDEKRQAAVKKLGADLAAFLRKLRA